MNKKLVIGLGMLLVGAFVGIPIIFLASLNPEALIIASTTNSYKMPQSISRAYLKCCANIDPAFRTSTGQTSLQFTLAGIELEGSSRDNIFEVANHLIQKGVNMTAIQEPIGLTVLHDAVLFNDLEVVKFLIDQGINVNVPAGGKYAGVTPLQFVYLLKKKSSKLEPLPDRTSIIEVLRKHGAK